MSVVTRYAPSPTGPLHIGGARTALFNWALARHHGGRFLLRVEDTDRARSTPEAERLVLEALHWLGLEHDPLGESRDIPRQSERFGHYAELIGPLLENGHAYRCTCTREDLAAMREQAVERGSPKRGYDGTCRDKGIGADSPLPFCIRLRVPEHGPTRFDDLIAGPSGEDSSQVDDFVIARTDGTPVYHLAVVVDDHDMGVTHVLRGREHMLSTPRQLLLCDALGFEPPAFAHLPLLVGPTGKKLSKREADASVQSYRDRGFPPEAVLNFLARLGWGHGDLETFDMKTFAELFTLEGVGKSPSQVDEAKLSAVSQHWMQQLPADRLRESVQPFLDAEAGRPVTIDAGLETLIGLLRPRSDTFADMARRARFYLLDQIEFDPKAARKHLKVSVREGLARLREALHESPDWSTEGIERVMDAVREASGLSLGQLAQPTRVSVTGTAASPGIFETLELLGRERTLERLDRALAHIDAGPA